MYKVIAVVVLIDIVAEKIVEADCNLSTRLSERFLTGILAGRSLQGGLEEIIQDMEEVYQGNAKKAIITALRVIYDKYLGFVQRKHKAAM